jgi:hypothetical protein
VTESSQTRIAPISELAIVLPGYSPRPEERKRDGKYLLIGGRNIKDGRLVTTNKDSYIDDQSKNSFRRAIVQPGDIIVSTLFDKRKLYIYQDTDPRAVVNNSCAIIRSPDNNDYIVSYLRTIAGREQFLVDATEATGEAFIPRLSVADLSSIAVPILPLPDLQRLGDEHIESSSIDALQALYRELQSKDAEIAELREQLNVATVYYEDRVRKIMEQLEQQIALDAERRAKELSPTSSLERQIAHGETSKLEFKSSLRWNLKAKRDDPRMELEVLKTIAAFCNTDGGTLLIGVDDDGNILGIAHDHFANNDKFLLHLRNLITGKLVPRVVQYVDFGIVSVKDKSICRVACKPSSQGVWLKADKNTEVFYVRHGPASESLLPREAVQYIQEHFQR